MLIPPQNLDDGANHRAQRNSSTPVNDDTTSNVSASKSKTGLHRREHNGVAKGEYCHTQTRTPRAHQPAFNLLRTRVSRYSCWISNSALTSCSPSSPSSLGRVRSRTRGCRREHNAVAKGEYCLTHELETTNSPISFRSSSERFRARYGDQMKGGHQTQEQTHLRAYRDQGGDDDPRHVSGQ